MDDEKKSLAYKIGYFLGTVFIDCIIAAGLAAVVLQVMDLF